MPEPWTTALQQAVQANCDIADARHAGELTLCSYLLQMREFFRWQQGLSFQAVPARDAVGGWIAEREALWDRLEGRDFEPLPLPAGGHADPFDVARVNAALRGSGLLYGAGRVGRRQAVFFLAEAHPGAPESPLPVQVAGRELARGLAAPPAALDGRTDPPTIVLRRDALARWCWQQLEAYLLHPRAGSAFDALLQHHPLQHDFMAALPRWTDEQCDALVLHERGEREAGLQLGPGWPALREALPSRRGELQARALRDHLADLGLTLPVLLQRGADASLHQWFAHFDGLRRQLFPALEEAYRAWRGGDGGAALRQACTQGHAHFLALARRALALHGARGDAGAGEVEALLCGPQAPCPARSWG